MPLDRHAKRLLDLLSATTAGPSAPQSVEERRQTLRTLSEGAESEPETVSRVADTSIAADHGRIRIRIYEGRSARRGLAPALVYLHGGGWVAGGLDTHDGFCRRLTNAAACQVIAVDYRLAPEHRFPAALEDCLTVFRWTVANAASLGLDAMRIGVGGDSTGAGLAAAACYALRDGGGAFPALQLLVCPVLDPFGKAGSRLAFGEGFFVDRAVFEQDLNHYCRRRLDPRDLRLSPLLADSFAGLPPAIIHAAEFDPFRDEGQAYADALTRAGVEARAVTHPGMIHYFYAMARAIPYADVAAAMIGSDVRDLFGDEAG